MTLPAAAPVAKVGDPLPVVVIVSPCVTVVAPDVSVLALDMTVGEYWTWDVTTTMLGPSPDGDAGDGSGEEE